MPEPMAGLMGGRLISSSTPLMMLAFSLLLEPAAIKFLTSGGGGWSLS